jgi:hypothetical protein
MTRSSNTTCLTELIYIHEYAESHGINISYITYESLLNDADEWGWQLISPNNINIGLETYVIYYSIYELVYEHIFPNIYSNYREYIYDLMKDLTNVSPGISPTDLPVTSIEYYTRFTKYQYDRITMIQPV